MRLACVKHAASVRSEPGSNSQVHHVPRCPGNPGYRETKRTNPASYSGSRFPIVERSETILTSVTVTHQKRYITATPISTLSLNQHRAHSKLHTRSDKVPRLLPALACRKHRGAANVSLPSNMLLSKNTGRPPVRPKPWVRRGRRLVGAVPPCVNAITPPTIIFSKSSQVIETTPNYGDFSGPIHTRAYQSQRKFRPSGGWAPHPTGTVQPSRNGSGALAAAAIRC